MMKRYSLHGGGGGGLAFSPVCTQWARVLIPAFLTAAVLFTGCSQSPTEPEELETAKITVEKVEAQPSSEPAKHKVSWERVPDAVNGYTVYQKAVIKTTVTNKKLINQAVPTYDVVYKMKDTISQVKEGQSLAKSVPCPKDSTSTDGPKTTKTEYSSYEYAVLVNVKKGTYPMKSAAIRISDWKAAPADE